MASLYVSITCAMQCHPYCSHILIEKSIDTVPSIALLSCAEHSGSAPQLCLPRGLATSMWEHVPQTLYMEFGVFGPSPLCAAIEPVRYGRGSLLPAHFDPAMTMVAQASGPAFWLIVPHHVLIDFCVDEKGPHISRRGLEPASAARWLRRYRRRYFQSKSRNLTASSKRLQPAGGSHRPISHPG